MKSRESHHDMFVNALDFPDSSRVLKLGDSVLLDSENDTVGSTDCNRGTTAVDSLEGILHLEELTIGGEHSVGFIVSRHFF